jgi:hypothetical protein
MAGATIANVWKAPIGVTPGVAGDATAPFALGTVSLITPPAATSRVIAKFCRVGATGVAAGATAGIGTDGVTTTAGAGNTFTNDTGVALVTGDYAWLTTGQTTSLVADEPGTFAGADSSRVWRLAKPDDEPAYPLDAITVLPSGSLGKFTKITGDVEPGAKVGDWTNDTGVKLVDGDYAWLTKDPAPPEAAQLPAAPPKRGAKAGETDDERKLREAEEAEYQKAERDRNKKTHS